MGKQETAYLLNAQCPKLHLFQMTKMNSFLLRRRRSIQYSGLSTIEEIRTSESYLEMSDPLGAGEGSKARSTCEYFLLDTNTFAKLLLLLLHTIAFQERSPRGQHRRRSDQPCGSPTLWGCPSHRGDHRLKPFSCS